MTRVPLSQVNQNNTVHTILQRLHLDGGGARPLPPVGLGRHLNVVHCVGGQVIQLVLLNRRTDADPNVLSEVGVVVIQLVACDAVYFLGGIPENLDFIGRNGISVKIDWLKRDCN